MSTPVPWFSRRLLRGAFLLLAALGTAAPAAPPMADFSAEIGKLREKLKSSPRDEESRARMAEIGWRMAAAIEDAEAMEEGDRARAIAKQIEQELPDIVWRTRHYAEHKDDARAQLARAVFHRTGTLLEQDETAACEYYRRASRQELPAALWRYSLCVARENREYGRTLLESAARAGHPTAQQVMAEAWMAEQNAEKREDAVELLMTSANAGRRSARLLLAALYETGTVMEKNIKLAEEIYREIATQGHPVAQNNLGALYQRNGDLAQASTWYLKAAEQDLPVAQLNLGLLYTQGQAPFDNGCEALKWIRRAADQSMEMARKILAEPAQYNIRCDQ